MNGIIPIVLGVIVLLSNNILINYYEKINLKFGVPVDRKIMFTRLIVGAALLILIGLGMIIRGGLSIS
jgi:hypothetical protein